MSTEVSGALMIGTGVDTSGIEEGAQQIELSLTQLGERASTAGASIQEAFANIPTVTNIDFTANFSSVEEAGNYIGEMYAEVARVIRLNQEGLNELSVKYKEAAKAADMYRNVPSMQEKYKEAVQQKDALKQLIEARKEAIAQAQSQETELGKVEKKILANAQANEKAANSTMNLRTRIRELTMEAAALRDAAQEQGQELDKSTGRYREIIEEIGRLKDIQGDIQSAGSVFANDENQFAGVLSGLNGLVGGFTAAQGAVALFGAENEDLQKIMLKVQSLMSITMGLQQVQQTLNKDSAFSLVTLNSLKTWWNKLLVVGAGAQATETAATEAHIAAATGDAVAETADATATEAAAVAKQTKAAASGEAAVAEGVDTVATGANAVAAGAGATANIGLAGAFRMVGAAIASIPVFGWIAAAIGVLIGVISHFVSESNKMEEQVKEKNELLKDSREAYIKAKVGIDDYTRRIDNFNGTAAEEKALVEKLNSEYGAQMGMHKTLAEWKDTLASKGEAYCRALEQEAVAQAYLNKYVEANIHLLEVRESIKSGKYHHWYNTKYGDQKADDEARRAAEAEVERYRQEYENAIAQANSIRQEGGLNLNFDLTPTTTPKGKGGGGGGSSAPTFDANAAAREQRKALEDYVAQVKSFIREANATVTDYEIQMQAEGLGRELMQIRISSEQRIDEWKRTLREQAELKKQMLHDIYMTKQGATEDKWEASDAGKMSIEDYMKEFLHGTDLSQIVDNIDLAKQLRDRLQDDDPAKAWLSRYVAEVEFAERQATEMRQKYYDQWVQEYGTVEQRIEKLNREWAKKLSTMPTEYLHNAIKQMNAEFAALESADFKKSINWESVFGDLGKQSLSTLQYNLDKIKAYFASNKDSMGATEIKDYQEAITKMEEGIASRNPFVALHKSIKDIGNAKTEFVAALQAWHDAQDGITTAQREYNEALAVEQALREQIDLGTLTEDSDKYREAEENLKLAKFRVAEATERNSRAEQRALSARNNITVSYKNFTTQLRAVGGVISGIGGQAQNLAAIFSDDVANGIGKALDTIDAVLDAASTVMDAIGDVGKGVAEGVEAAVASTAQGATAAAAAGAASISTIEKASVILAVISAVLQVATVIANLINDDDSKQKEIENLQSRIDQLQWELDNADTVRLQNNVGDAVQKLRDIYAETTQEVLRLHLTSQQYGNSWTRMISRMRYDSEVYEKSIEKIADTYAKVAYTADKALGGKRYDESRKQLENLAEQQILIQKQINEEQSKKKTDNGKIEEWQRQIQEIAQEMASIINEMLEDIIGYTAADLASELGDAFFEAAKQGEDAMEAWRKKANDIVADVLQRMLVQKYLEERIGGILDKYKKEWFGNDGSFKGIDAVIGSMNEFAGELNQVGEEFNAIYQALSDSLKNYFTGDAEREGTQKGIATASQDSVDENNARLTTIQGHTYTLTQGMAELNRTSSLILDKVAGIEENTAKSAETLDEVSDGVKKIKNSVDEIQQQGIKIRP
ncbi:hypothetical protein EEK90_06860 [Muribaculaceae bacterium Isolate-036 (Harlan)]|nr:hypothetical protein EEK90_06860 [Muribaculaceae bacterium Isolate-036 (Harlan)]